MGLSIPKYLIHCFILSSALNSICLIRSWENSYMNPITEYVILSLEKYLDIITRLSISDRCSMIIFLSILDTQSWVYSEISILWYSILLLYSRSNDIVCVVVMSAFCGTLIAQHILSNTNISIAWIAVKNKYEADCFWFIVLLSFIIDLSNAMNTSCFRSNVLRWSGIVYLKRLHVLKMKYPMLSYRYNLQLSTLSLYKPSSTSTLNCSGMSVSNSKDGTYGYNVLLTYDTIVLASFIDILPLFIARLIVWYGVQVSWQNCCIVIQAFNKLVKTDFNVHLSKLSDVCMYYSKNN